MKEENGLKMHWSIRKLIGVQMFILFGANVGKN